MEILLPTRSIWVAPVQEGTNKFGAHSCHNFSFLSLSHCEFLSGTVFGTGVFIQSGRSTADARMQIGRCSRMNKSTASVLRCADGAYSLKGSHWQKCRGSIAEDSRVERAARPACSSSRILHRESTTKGVAERPPCGARWPVRFGRAFLAV